MERRSTIEMKALIQQQLVALRTPPPLAPAGTSLREWFAGLAIGNVELMKDIDRERYGTEALRIADQLLFALATPRQPTVESMAALSDEQMEAWSAKIVAENLAKVDKHDRNTVREMQAVTVAPSKRSKTLLGVAVPSNPPPNYVPPLASRPAAAGRMKSMLPDAATEPAIRTIRPGQYGIKSPPEGTTIPLEILRKA